MLNECKILKSKKQLDIKRINSLEKEYPNKIIRNYLKNFLTDNDIKIIDSNFYYKFDKDRHSILGDRRYSLEIENKWHTKK